MLNVIKQKWQIKLKGAFPPPLCLTICQLAIFRVVCGSNFILYLTAPFILVPLAHSLSLPCFSRTQQPLLPSDIQMPNPVLLAIAFSLMNLIGYLLCKGADLLESWKVTHGRKFREEHYKVKKSQGGGKKKVSFFIPSN